MPEPNDAFIAKKNLAANKPLFLYTIYDWNSLGDDLNFAAYPTAVVYDGVTYDPFPIMHESVGENTQGQIDKVSIRVSNVGRLMSAYLETYDLRAKKVRIRSVFSDLLSDADAHLDEIFYIEDYLETDQMVEFNLSSKFDILDVSLPLRRYTRNYCSWAFKGTECKYAGGETTCNKTIQRCRELSNIVNFGGFPSIPYKRLIV